MNPDLRQLRKLQLVDSRILELSREIARLPKYVAEIEAKLDSHKKALAADQATLEENRKVRRKLEGEIAAHQQKLSHLRDQMNEAKTNEQFRAFQKEIEYGENEIRKVEDRILDKMVEAENLEGNVAGAEKALKVESEVVAKEIKETEARVAKDEEELAEARKSRKELSESVTPAVMRLYDRVLKLRGGRAVADATSDRCLACNVLLRPHVSQRLQQAEEVLTCESCGRILYLPEWDEAPLEDPAGESNLAV